MQKQSWEHNICTFTWLACILNRIKQISILYFDLLSILSLR